MPQVGSPSRSSKYRGVSKHKRSGKWQVNLYYDRKLHHIGLFSEEREAAQAHDERARSIWGGGRSCKFPHTRGRCWRRKFVI
jgi:hypothetical protein